MLTGWRRWNPLEWDSGMRGFFVGQIILLAVTLGLLGLIWWITDLAGLS